LVVGVGATSSTDHLIAKMILGYRFDFEPSPPNLALTLLPVTPYNYGLSLGLGGVMYAVIKSGESSTVSLPATPFVWKAYRAKWGEQVKFGTVLSVHTMTRRFSLATMPPRPA